MRLCVSYPDGRKDYFPLPFGTYQIGSNDLCSIRIANESIADIHAVLDVSNNGVFITNLKDSENFFVNEKTLSAKKKIYSGDRIRIGNIKIDLQKIILNEEESLNSQNGTLSFAQQLIGDFLKNKIGYKTIQTRLGEEVSESEMLQAKKKFSIGKSIFIVTMLFTIFAYLLNFYFCDRSLEADDIIGSIINFVVAVVTFFLVSYFQVPYAGRWLYLILSITGLVNLPDLKMFTDDSYLITVILIFYYWVIGFTLDIGFSTNKFRKYKIPRRIFLTFILIINQLFVYWLKDKPFSQISDYIYSAIDLLMILLAWIGIPLIEKVLNKENYDVSIVKFLSFIRWRRFIFGRILAVLFALLYISMILLYQGSKEKFEDVQFDSNAIVSIDQNKEKNVWYWTLKGDFISKEDLDGKIFSPNIKYYYYGLQISTTEIGNEKEIVQWLENLENNNEDIDSFKKIQERLKNYRITSENKEYLEQLLSISNREDRFILVLEETKTKNKTTNIKVSYSIGIKGYTPSEIKNKIQIFNILFYFSIPLFIIGFTFIWRKGGDSKFAFWIGIFYLSTSCLQMWYNSNELVLDHIKMLLTLNLGSSYICSLFATFMNLSEIVLLCCIYLNSMSLPLSICFVYLCWPNKDDEIENLFVNLLEFLGKVLTICLIVNAPSFLCGIIFDFIGYNYAIAPVLGCVIANITLLSLGIYLYKKNKAILNVKGFTVSLILVYLIQQLCAILILPIFNNQYTSNYLELAEIAIPILSGLMLFVFFFAIIKNNFLNLFSAKDLSVSFFAFIIPSIVGFCNMLFASFFNYTSILSKNGHRLISVLFVVFIMKPVWNILNDVFNYIANPKAKEVSNNIREILETSFSKESSNDFNDRINALLEKWDIKSYSFYKRISKNTFSISTSKWTENNVENVEISNSLINWLANNNSFIDLKNVSEEWKYWFYEFEFYRIERKIDCKYIFPIVLGNTLQGFLAMPENTGKNIIEKADTQNELNALGISVISGK